MVEKKLSKRIEEIMKKLVSIKSDTSTLEEKDIEDYIYKWFADLNYFKQNKNYFGKFDLKDDHLERSIVWALVKGETNKTIIFLNHHDAVDIDVYGKLSNYACDVETLKNKIINTDISKDTKSDLESDEWFFGRGSCDMKGGAAIQMALLEKYSKKKNFKGNLLFISVPDEESLSAGMRNGVKLLNNLKEKFDLNYLILINSEPHQREESNVGRIFTGSVGKIMPIVYVRGKKTHIGDIFKGLNPILLLSTICKKIELNPKFCDVVGDEISPPPSWSFARDRKRSYDASIPQSAGGYFSILTMNRTPKEILEDLKNIIQESFVEIINDMNEKYKMFGKKVNKEMKKLPWESKVKSFSELYKKAVNDYGNEFIEKYDKTINKVKEDIKNDKINLPESNFILIETTLEFIDDLSPMVVIAFSPPYYPHVNNQNLKIKNKDIENLSDKIINYADKSLNKRYEKKNYFMGISDLSYTALDDEDDVIPYIGPNMPLWNKLYRVPFKEMKKLNIPSFIIGPWGKNLHKFAERVHKESLTKTTPVLIEFVINELF
ncbi:M20/M25/M40 family metallo-hydrolase [Halanaerobium sp. MA284_MarDTE_T2]|uniref:M20/M25/M40 family metallo-hydrolase n=1 Tax=Halanaerobium sp. MA284_MarDTE_T2 TaxID=2183913 RepID=UPI000DF1AA7A|nr:M20/M25/M40 family metallo-hydrolase [Halanaerobium sp. MA284_MarDTE_T2]RCW41711.1 arginine utilization protein RocB [Halanaerobium sp. MA284_MarDTE_T2]